MIRIIMCDDNQIELSAFETKVRNYLRARSLLDHVSVTTFTSSSQLWFQLMENDIGEIFILDVDMPKMNGLELAEQIRRKHPAAIIYFLSSHTEYATEGYKVDALRYISKDVSDSDFFEALEHALRKYDNLLQKYIVVSHHRDCCKIPYSEILYVQRIDRVLEIHTRSWDVRYDRRGIREFYDILNDPHFLFIERSVFVNIDIFNELNNPKLSCSMESV